MEKTTVQDQDLIPTKVLRKLKKYLENKNGELKVETTPDLLSKRAFILQSFQVIGKLFNIEIGVENRANIGRTKVTFENNIYLKEFNSRSFHGFHIFYNVEDIAKKLLLTTDELKPIFKELKEHVAYTPQEIKRVESKYLKKQLQKT